MRKIGTTLVAGALLFGLVGNAFAAKPVTVFEDPANDAGNTEQGLALPPATLAGLDLVSGTVVKSGADLEFTVTNAAALPQAGSAPEAFRLLWHINSGGEEYRFTVKSLDVGKPDVIAQEGTDRLGQVYQGLARLEQCSEEALPAVLTLVNCKGIEYFQATFDPAAATITWKVPLASIKAKTGTVIAGGTTAAASTNCQICWVPHYAERSLTPSTIVDQATMAKSYKVPKK
ncbi:MAG TPA: hypothetical protein VHN37_05570 [Actinomycetota bacterium]|nr:hypothetical protein [Actinomycetota bacterium]